MKATFVKLMMLLMIPFLGMVYLQAQDSQGLRNTDFFGNEPSKPHPLTQNNNSPRYSPTAGCNVLIVCADDDATSGSPIQTSLQSYGDLGNVDLYDARTSTPSLADLEAYEVVITWCNYGYYDAVAMGNVLADYVDAGGKVINPVWTIGIGGNLLHGRFIEEDYTAMQGGTWPAGWACLGAYNAGHPIMNGVTQVCDSYRISATALTAGSTSVAEWSDGLIFVAAKDDGSVVTINGYVGYYYAWSGQMPDVVHNSVLWLCQGPERVPVSNWALAIGVLMILGFTVIRFVKNS
jgi:hypothetical protein